MQTANAGGMAQYSSLIVLVAMFALMWVLIVRPQKKREKETENMRNSLSVGDEIITIGGFYGKVVKVKQDSLVIQCGTDRTRLEVTKWAVQSVVNKVGTQPKVEEETEEKETSKPTPKTIKKLGKKDPEAPEEMTE